MRRGIVPSSAMSVVVAFAVALGVAAVGRPPAVSAQDGIPAVESVTIVDAGGIQRMLLQSGPGIAALIDLLANDGTRRVVLHTGGIRGNSPDAAALNIYRSDGSRVIRLGIEQEQLGGRLPFEDREGNLRLAIAVDEEGAPTMTMWDANGNVTWSAP